MPGVVRGEEAQAAPVAAVAAPPAQPVGVGDTEHDHQLVLGPRFACSDIQPKPIKKKYLSKFISHMTPSSPPTALSRAQ